MFSEIVVFFTPLFLITDNFYVNYKKLWIKKRFMKEIELSRLIKEKCLCLVTTKTFLPCMSENFDEDSPKESPDLNMAQIFLLFLLSNQNIN